MPIAISGTRVARNRAIAIVAPLIGFTSVAHAVPVVAVPRQTNRPAVTAVPNAGLSAVASRPHKAARPGGGPHIGRGAGDGPHVHNHSSVGKAGIRAFGARHVRPDGRPEVSKTLSSSDPIPAPDAYAPNLIPD